MGESMTGMDLLKECLDFNDQVDVWSYHEEIDIGIIQQYKSSLQVGAKLYIGIDNANALRYDCGDFPDGPCYLKDEVSKILRDTGLYYKCYSVYPCLEYPQFVYSEKCLPNEELMIRYFPKYNHPETVFEIEEFKIDSLISQGLFHEKANAYIFECSTQNDFSDISHITFSADRYPDKAFATIIRNNGTVTKQALFPAGKQHLISLAENIRNLKCHSIPVIMGELQGNRYVMPYVDAILATTYLKNALKESRKRYFELYDRFVELILQSSDHVDENEDGIILARGYIDMVPLNAFFNNGDFQFFDQEYYLENCPAKAVIYRAILITYCGDDEVERLCPLLLMLERYGLLDRHAYWHHYTDAFFESLRDQTAWSLLQQKHGRNNLVAERNRRKREMLQGTNCFSEIGNRNVYIFGTGRFADKFMDMYHNDYHIVAAVDNNTDKQGTIWKGIPVLPPEALKDKKENYVMICVKDYDQIVSQLKELGIEYMGVYDAHHVYPGRQADNIPYTGKPYHIGYCAGVYDLFHIGHVNIFRRAKEQCDYLIVGVVTDEGVRNNKHREPFIPYEERLEMVRSCRYVDEAVEIPYIYCRTPDMFEKYHFDVQFSGSDYEHDPGWLAMKQYLNERGAEMLFFPYTECTSSTKIKALIEKGLAD